MTKPRRLATLRARLARDAMILWIAARDPRTPLAAKILGGLVAAYAFSPIDFIPDFVPVFGLIDDLLLLPLGLALALWLIPAPLVAEFRASADAAAARPVSRSGALLVGALWVFLVAVAAMQLVTLRYW
ncbi:YkvA family protein [Thermaurantiacus sp.]